MSERRAVPTVLEVDLREHYQRVLSSDFDALRKDLLRDLDAQRGEVSRVLVIDRGEDLIAHAAGLQKIINADVSPTVICLALAEAEASDTLAPDVDYAVPPDVPGGGTRPGWGDAGEADALGGPAPRRREADVLPGSDESLGSRPGRGARQVRSPSPLRAAGGYEPAVDEPSDAGLGLEDPADVPAGFGAPADGGWRAGHRPPATYGLPQRYRSRREDGDGDLSGTDQPSAASRVGRGEDVGWDEDADLEYADGVSRDVGRGEDVGWDEDADLEYVDGVSRDEDGEPAGYADDALAGRGPGGVAAATPADSPELEDPEDEDPYLGVRPGRGGYVPPGGEAYRPEPRWQRVRRLPDGIALVKPYELRAPVATLWVSSLVGVPWAMGDRSPGEVVALDADDETLVQRGLLGALLDALRQPEVFDQVAQRAAAMGEATAAPGLRVVTGRISDALYVEALRAATDRITSAERGESRGRLTAPATVASPDGAAGLDDPAAAPIGPAPGGTSLFGPADLLRDPLPMLLGVPTARPADAGVPAADGIIGVALREVRAAVEEAAAATAGMLAPRTILRSRRLGRVVGERAHEAGVRLAELRGGLADDFLAIDSRQGLDVEDRQRLAELGIPALPPTGVDSPKAAAALRTMVETGLRRGFPLGQVTGWVEAAAAELLPRGSADRVGELHAACPNDALDRLDLTGDVRLPLYGPSAVVPGLLGCAFVGQWRPLTGLLGAVCEVGLVLVAVVAVTIGGIGLGLARRVDRDGGGMPDLLVLMLAALVGAAAGWEAARRAGWLTGWLSDAVLALGAVIVLLWPFVAWRRAIRRWAPSFDEAYEMLAAVGELVREVAFTEWVLADRRLAAYRIADTVVTVLRDTASTLFDVARSLDAPDTPDTPPVPGIDTEVAERLRDASSEVAGVVHTDLVELVVSVLEPYWNEFGRDFLEAPTRSVRRRTERAFHAYYEHLRRLGVHQTPVFGRDSRDRAALLESVWLESRQFVAVMGAAVDDGDILQLNTIRDLRLVDADPERGELIRFAPRAARPALRAHSPLPAARPAPGDLAWTDGGQVAGVLRLARMGRGTVGSAVGRVS